DSTFDYDSWQAKLVALELANEVGRAIMKLVSKKPYSATQISKKLGLPISTVMFHLARLETVDLVTVARGYGKRLRDVKYYRARSSKIVFDFGGGEK
ncbi:MAG: winged helix-turn-helix domain-containing protein, partial [Candidatus Bathyarchaeota archaeon]|nr:winged helix-turn-helix domain-containing protein [Candidatus Bathyarchaeota archaeon]